MPPSTDLNLSQGSDYEKEKSSKTVLLLYSLLRPELSEFNCGFIKFLMWDKLQQ